MKTQRGFIGLPVLILIVLGLAVLGGGTYFVLQQKSTSQTTSENSDATIPTDTQVSPETKTQTDGNTQTQNAQPKTETQQPTKQEVKTSTSIPQTDTSTPVPPKIIPLSVEMSKCGEITKSGNYIITSDLAAAPDHICINIFAIKNVSLDCQNHTITSLRGNTIRIAQTTDFVLKNCISSSKANVNIIDSQRGEIFNNTFDNLVSLSQSNDIHIHSNVFLGDLQPTFTGSLLNMSNGKNNVVKSNTFDGRSDGINLGEQDSIGFDDAIVITNESGDTIQENDIKNFYDCGIENVGYIYDSKIIGNKIQNTGVCAIGGWFDSSLRGNVIKDNVARDVPSLFVFWLSSDIWLRSTLPATEINYYFKDNMFENNTFTDPKFVTKPFVSTPSQSYFSITNSVIPASQLIVGNNIFRNNHFPQSASAIFFQPSSMVVDGGGNVCTKPSGAAFPLECNSIQ